LSPAIFHGLWTAALLVVFIAIVIWAWSGKRKRDFDAAARLPLDDEELDAPGAGSERKPHG
jgi:cytochrome c oxidase cbb3-type subunit 4